METQRMTVLTCLKKKIELPYEDFFRALGYQDNEKIFLRTFSDRDKTEEGRKKEVLLSRFDQIISSLRKENEENRGIFFVVNGSGHNDKDVLSKGVAKAQFMEIDDLSFEEQAKIIDAFPLEPSIVIQTKRSLHPYWILIDGDIKRFRNIQERLVSHFNGDPVIVNESRVMRLYGFNHCKSDPVEVRLIKWNPELRYTQDQLAAVLPEVKKKSSSRGNTQAASKSKKLTLPDTIHAGSRNDILFRLACSLISQGLDRESVRSAVEIENEKRSDPPLDDAEIEKILNSAYRYAPENPYINLEPEHYTDVDEAIVFTQVFGRDICYTPQTHFMVYENGVWIDNQQKAQKYSQRLTYLQMREAKKRYRKADDELLAAKESGDQSKVKAAQEKVEDCDFYFKFVLKRRGSKAIQNTLQESKAMLSIDFSLLDADPYLLNTPSWTINLRTGELLPHRQEDYCTKMTAVDPDHKNEDVFFEFLHQISCNDQDWEYFLQEIVGMCAIGKVIRENLIIANGEGGNGKTTTFSLIQKVLGTYASSIDPNVLTADYKGNLPAQIAELRGQRFVIASELEEGKELNTGTMKSLCSTDTIAACKKYKDPFFFTPSHTMLLFTNHLPRVRSTDNGTWDRIILLPFMARFRNTDNEIKDYSAVLFEQCGGAVLTWIIEGAKRFIAQGGRIEAPECVKNAIAAYREENDTIADFLENYCIVNADYREKACRVYEAYRNYCTVMAVKPKTMKGVKAELEAKGIRHDHNRSGSFFYGLVVRQEGA